MSGKKLKPTTVHAILKSLSPKREIESPRKGRRCISRSLSADALIFLTDHLNSYLMAIVEACEASLQEVNNNPNSYYKRHKYDLQVAKLAIEKLEEKDNDL